MSCSCVLLTGVVLCLVRRQLRIARRRVSKVSELVAAACSGWMLFAVCLEPLATQSEVVPFFFFGTIVECEGRNHIITTPKKRLLKGAKVTPGRSKHVQACPYNSRLALSACRFGVLQRFRPSWRGHAMAAAKDRPYPLLAGYLSIAMSFYTLHYALLENSLATYALDCTRPKRALRGGKKWASFLERQPHP